MATAATMVPPEVQGELTRLKNEVLAKDETLNQLKLKTKAFVDNMRNELAVEKKKVGDLEEQLKRAGSNSTQPTAAPPAEVEALKKELILVAQREHELKAKAKAFADSMKAQVQTEKDRSRRLEQELAAKDAALALAQASVASSSASHDLLALDDRAPAATNNSNNQQVATLQAQLNTAQQELAAMTDRLRHTEDLAAQRAQDVAIARGELEALQCASEQQLAKLRIETAALQSKTQELERALNTSSSSQLSAAASSSSEDAAMQRQQLDDALAAQQDALHQLQQYKIENEHLQKQLLDKDFLLEQLESYRERADESESRAKILAGELAAAQTALQMSADDAARPCATCVTLQREVAELATLYDKVNIGRSQSDLQLAETQSALQTAQQAAAAAKDRIDELAKQNMALNESVFRKDADATALRNDVARLTADAAALADQVSASRSDSRTRREQSEAALADTQRLDAALSALRTEHATLETAHRELRTALEAANRDSVEKRQKAKTLVIALTTEKQSLTDARNELQREVERLRMELNQRNVETERRLKQLADEHSQRVAQSSSTLQGLTDEVATLKQTLAIVQESEKNQQRAKELAAAKREVDDSTKKRLAAKAETQRLAVELESVQRCLSHLSDAATTSCAASVRKMAQLHERVAEALHVLEKRASAAGKKQSGDGRNTNQSDLEVEDLREPESVRDKPTSPTQSARKVEETIAGVSERLTLLVEAAEKLCDLALEQNDVTLKDVVVDRFTMLFTQCFSEKLRTAYAKVDEADAFSDSNQSTKS